MHPLHRREVRNHIVPVIQAQVADLFSCTLDPDELDGQPYCTVTPGMVKVVRLAWMHRFNSVNMKGLSIVVFARPFRARLGHEREYARKIREAVQSLPLLSDGTAVEVNCILPPFGWSGGVVGEMPL